MNLFLRLAVVRIMSTVTNGMRAMTGRRAQGASWLPLRLAGAGLLFAAAGIHLDLYLTGYRTIPTIGWLFLLQVIAGFLVGAVVLVTTSRLAAAVGALLALGTLGGYLLSVQFGLFGFREVRTTAGIVAGIIDVAAFVALAVYAAASEPGRGDAAVEEAWRAAAGHARPGVATLPTVRWRQAFLG